MLRDFIAEFRQRLAALGEPQNTAERVVFQTITNLLQEAENERIARQTTLPKSFEWDSYLTREYDRVTYVDGFLTAAEMYRTYSKTP